MIFHKHSMKKLLFYAFSLVAGLALTACDDDTVSVGAEVLPDMDKITTSTQTFTLNSRSHRADSVLANTNSCYLGSIVDPETRSRTTCDFLAQYHVVEDFRLPESDKIVMEDGKPVCDTCYIRLYAANTYGDELTPMKLNIYELSKDKVMSEGTNYFTDVKPAEFLPDGALPLVQQTYTLGDFRTLSSSTLREFDVQLPKEFGAQIMSLYYEHPEYFKNSYRFLRNVLAGFYLQTSGGVGAMANVTLSDLILGFKYHATNAAGRDTIYSGWHSFAATEEVLQNTRVDNQIPESMLNADNDYTYVKSPAGIFTLVDLPVDDIVGGEHFGDTINSARILFPRIAGETAGTFALQPPTTLLLLRKANMYDFFETNVVSDGRTSFVSNFLTAYNAYAFDNIAPLISLIRSERDAGAGVSAADSEAERAAKYRAWEAANPDWATVALVPVAMETLTQTNALSGTSYEVLQLRNELGLSSVKLEGGPRGKLSIEVTYSRFN